jgi:uncharacterized protein with von Willebrand factor type A (vWA) domain
VSQPGAGGGRRAGLFAGVDRALVMAAMAERLRRAGIAVPLGASERATAALSVVAADGRLPVDQLYWLTRLSFVADHNQLATFDSVFEAVFLSSRLHNEQRRPGARDSGGLHRAGGQLHRLGTARDGPSSDGGGLPWATRPPVVADAPGEEPDERQPTIPELRPVAVAGDPDKPFDQLDESELERVGQLLADTDRWPMRASRRRETAAGGDRLMLRATLRRALRTGGEPLVLQRSRARARPRPVVLLLDVSGSMESFATAYLHVARALATGRRAEVFAFATRLTRVTPALRLRTPGEAVGRASDEVDDRFGGTRLATSVGELVGHRSWSSAVRGAVVVVVSDGWDTDPPALLERHLGRLRRMAHRIIWVNPRLAADSYEPKVTGMATALPFCDHFLPGHSPAAMSDVIAAITAK